MSVLHKVFNLFFIFILGILIFTSVDVRHNFATIEVSSEGFNPNSKTISQGETISFLIVDDTPHWPASDIHPSHTSYPDSDIRKCNTLEKFFVFDACRSLKKGERYSFTFNEPGRWTFHDHLAPRYSGVIFVTQVEGFREPLLSNILRFLSHWFTEMTHIIRKAENGLSSLPGLIEGAKDASGLMIDITLSRDELTSDKDYEKETIRTYILDDIEIRKIVNQLGVARTMEKLLQESGDGSQSGCHLSAHYVGRAAYDVFKESAFKDCNASCHSGCYHGAMEAFFWDYGPLEILSRIGKVCDAFESEFAKLQCFHGSGHGFLALQNYDLPRALEHCETFNNYSGTTSCYEVVFMENVMAGLGISSGVDAHITDWLSLDDMHFPCNTLQNNKEAHELCYERQSSWALLMSGRDYDFAIDFCSDAPTQRTSELCFKGLGRNISGESLRSPDVVNQGCKNFPEEFLDECVVGAIDTVIDFWSSNFLNYAKTFCSALEEGIAQKTCYTRITERIPEVFLHKEDRITACRKLPNPFSTSCVARL